MKKITGLEFLAILFNLFIGAVLLIDAIKNGSNGYIYASVVCLLASFISGLCAQRGHEITELTQEYADVNHQRLQALKEKDEACRQLSLLRQKHSRTNQPRSGGKFVKGENFISKVGDSFKCNRDFVMNEGWVAFTSGRTYLCEADGCLTDNQGHYMHGMGEDSIKLYFTRVTL